MVKVLSVGGSIICPGEPDTAFLTAFSAMIRSWLDENAERKLILVAGGGGPARIYQKAYRDVCSIASAGSHTTALSLYNADEADWLGITATKMNAQLLKAIFSGLCTQEVINDPTAPIEFGGRILVASGWKPGFSTDTDAVYLAERFGAKTIINLSNIEKIYTDDPKTNPNAQPLDSIGWSDFRKMVGDEWVPGKNCPFDPVASKRAEQDGISVICAGGKDINNILAVLNEQNFIGTVIS